MKTFIIVVLNMGIICKQTIYHIGQQMTHNPHLGLKKCLIEIGFNYYNFLFFHIDDNSKLSSVKKLWYEKILAFVRPMQ